MFLHPVLLDASMSASAALARLARYGLWLDPDQPDARAWIDESATRRGIPADEMEKRLRAATPEQFGAAIRRQWNQNVLWYARPVAEVLSRCSRARPDDTLLNAMGLHEVDSQKPFNLADGGSPTSDGVVLLDQQPVGVNFADAAGGPRRRGELRMGGSGGGGGQRATPRRGATPGMGGASDEERPSSSPSPVSLWPRVDARTYAQALVPFDAVVGLGKQQQQDLAGGQVTLNLPQGVQSIDLTVDLIADGVDAPDGWSRVLQVNLSDPTANQVSFRLIGRAPEGTEPFHLTTLEIRYVLNGSVCGIAAHPLVIGLQPQPQGTPGPAPGVPWLAHVPTASPINLTPDDLAADLTIELAKPDRNPTAGHYVCRLYSRHKLKTPAGPWDVYLGDDAKTFAHSMIQGIRQLSSGALTDNYLRSVGDLVTQTLPAEVFDALQEAAAKVTPATPSVLVVSAEPFVPWELATLPVPLTPQWPPFLCAQTVLGRWFRDSKAAATPSADALSTGRLTRPPAQPPSVIPVKQMAVMVGMYKPSSGLQKLPAAEAEAQQLATAYKAVELAASQQALSQLLNGQLEQNFKQVGWADAVHFAGHGQFDPNEPDSSVLFLGDGTPMSSMLFRSANRNNDRQPLIFLNACMVGTGGEVLGDMGGFPGNCLRGGFGAVLGALWEVDDTIASNIARTFWDRVLPTNGAAPEEVGAVLRDIRANYNPASSAPVSTYLAYTYYGHPRLKLRA